MSGLVLFGLIVGLAAFLHLSLSSTIGRPCERCGATTDQTPIGDACPFCDKEFHRSWFR